VAKKKSSAEEQQDKLINLQAQQLAAQVANWAAQLEFQKERLRLLELPEMQNKAQIDIDRLAWDKAQGEWDRAFKEASITGTYNGQPTIEWLTQQAQLTGVLDGKQTLQGKLTDAQIRQMNESMRLANDEFIANTTGYFNGQRTFDREKFEAGQAQDAWKFLATLTGPSNAFKQARAISSMPGGMSDLMNAWAGKYTLPGSTAVGSGGPASLGGLMLGAAGNYDFPAPAASTGGGPPGVVPTPVTTAPPGPAYGAPTAPLTTPPPAGNPLSTGAGPDAGFWVWLRVHDRIPDPANAAAELPQLVASYNSLPAGDHQAYINAGNADPGSFSYDLPGMDALGIPANPWIGGTTPPTGPPAGTVTPPNTASIPGRGFPTSAWNDATRAAAAAWNAANPGWVLDGSAVGYHWVGRPVTQQTTPPVNPGIRIPAPVQAPGAGTEEPTALGNYPREGPGTTPGGGIADFWWPQGGGKTATDWSNMPGTLLATTNSMPYTYSPAGAQAPVEQWNYAPTLSGSMQVYPPGVQSPYDTPDVSARYALAPSVASNIYRYGGTTYGGATMAAAPVASTAPAPVSASTDPLQQGTAYSGMMLPSQINAKNYAKSYQYQKDLGWAAYEDAGWDKALAQEAFERSLPKTGGPKFGSFAF
jgi:hypothetical protein